MDLKAKTVTTVAGDGKQSNRRVGSGPGKTTGLNSPWDVLLLPGTDQLAIAMAGPHQIWKYDISSGEVSVWAGSGVENILDGSLPAARFAQPSGLATDGKNLFVADSEVSAVRAIRLAKDAPLVQTIVGGRASSTSATSTARGRRSGSSTASAWPIGDGKLYIADSYNNKIKVCDPKTRIRQDLRWATPRPARPTIPPGSTSRAGLSLAGTTLYVADTNNHKIRTVDINSGAVKTLELEGLKPPTPRRRPPSFSNAVVTNAPAVKVAPGDSVKLEVALNLPPGYKVTDQAPMPYLIETPGKEAVLSRDVVATVRNVDPPAQQFSVDVPLAQPASKGDAVNLKLSVQAFGCNEGSSLCKVFNFVYNVPITFEEGGVCPGPARLRRAHEPRRSGSIRESAPSAGIAQGRVQPAMPSNPGRGSVRAGAKPAPAGRRRSRPRRSGTSAGCVRLGLGSAHQAEPDGEGIAQGLPLLGGLQLVVFADRPQGGLVGAEGFEPGQDPLAERLVEVAGPVARDPRQLGQREDRVGRSRGRAGSGDRGGRGTTARPSREGRSCWPVRTAGPAPRGGRGTRGRGSPCRAAPAP